jgi:hypothetical protein
MSLSIRNSEGFDSTVIEMAFNRHESPFWDAKGELYRFNAGGRKEEILVMLIKHLIAFANISRSSGKPCFMIFGINDKTWVLQDVREQFVEGVKPEYWDDESIPILKKQGDGVDTPYQNYARESIAPAPPRMQLEYGIYKGVFVSYLKIAPEYPSVPYSLKKKLGKHGAGTVFCRYGSSTVQIDVAEAKSLFSASQATYIEPVQWRDYINCLRSGEFAKGDARATFPIRLPNGENAKDNVMKLLEQGRKSIMVIGPAGQGKTTLMLQLTYYLAKLHDLEQMEFHSEFGSNEEKVTEDTVLPATRIKKGVTQKVPFYMELSNTFANYGLAEG